MSHQNQRRPPNLRVRNTEAVRLEHICIIVRKREVLTRTLGCGDAAGSTSGPWTTINTSMPSPPDDQLYTLSRAVSDGANRLRKWIRWRVDQFDTAGAVVSFRIVVTVR